MTVIGGRVGLDFTGYMSGTQPTPVITGFTLSGQTEAAIRSTSRQTLVAVGLKIVADRCAGPLIQVGQGLQANHGELTMVDSAIEFSGAALAQAERVVVASDRGVYLDNVYVRGATKVMVDPEQKIELAGNPQGWLHVRRFAAPSSPRVNQGHTYRYPVYVDGRQVERLCEVVPDVAPPAGLQAQHLWAPQFPSFESPGAANVKDAPYRAKGDGRTDDTAAIQRAMDQSEIVFLPKGCYLLTRPLELEAAHQAHRSRADHVALGRRPKRGPSPTRNAPRRWSARRTWPNPTTVLAFLGLYTPAKVAGAQSLHWRSGGRSVFRGVEIKGRSSVSPAPVIISGHGGGNWYNFRDGSARLLVDHAQGPLRFYQFSVQQVTSELRGARHVSFFGTKYEGNDPMLTIRDSDHIRLFGHGGNAKGLRRRLAVRVRADRELPLRQRRGRPDEDRQQEPQPSGRQHRPAALAHAHRPPGQQRRTEAAAAANAPSSTNEARRKNEPSPLPSIAVLRLFQLWAFALMAGFRWAGLRVTMPANSWLERLANCR